MPHSVVLASHIYGSPLSSALSARAQLECIFDAVLFFSCVADWISKGDLSKELDIRDKEGEGIIPPKTDS